MSTNFDADDYVAALQTLLTRQAVGITVEGFVQDRDYAKLAGGPIAELQIDGFQTTSVGVPGTLSGVLRAGLLVMVQLSENEAEAKAFELALEVAASLVDEAEVDDEPVMVAGTIKVTSIEPESPDGALTHRVAAYLVSFEQEWWIQRQNVETEEQTIKRLYLGREPNVGPDHVDDYTLIAGDPPEEP